MSQTTVNPYEEIGGYIQTGLASIIASLPASPTIDQWVAAVTAYVGPLFYGGTPTNQVSLEMKQVARTAINSYVNNNVLGGQDGYNGNQIGFIRLLIGNLFTSNLPVVSIANRIGDVEDNLTDNQLSVPEQTPLLLATTIGSNANTYWKALPSGWSSYYPASPEDYMDIPYYVEAAMAGALAGYAATPDGMIEPSVNFVTNKQVSALIGALTVTGGKVIYQWIQRMQHDGISNFNTNLR